MKSVFSSILLAAVAISMTTGCQDTKASSTKAHSPKPPTQTSAKPEETSKSAPNTAKEEASKSTEEKTMAAIDPSATTSANEVAWKTNSTVPNLRQIEVGDHPNIQLDQFTLGNRPQRVRFFNSDEINITKYVFESPQDMLFQTDLKIGRPENTKWSLFGMIIEPAVNVGLAKFSDNATYNGVAVSPQLLLCATGALERLKTASATRGKTYQSWQINVVNIFVKPVQHASDAESKMAIEPKLNALNFQVSMWTRSGDCFLPTAEQIGEALDIADQRVED
ncbi:MAG: hypothetical protein AB7H97_11670 [Pseudobdellovibrionaceae bacterium]